MTKTAKPKPITNPTPVVSIPPPWKWAGSKRRALEEFGQEFIPTEPFDLFIDAFAGSLRVSMFIRERFPNVRIIANEKNVELFRLYSVMQNSPDKFMNEMKVLETTWLAQATNEDRKNLYRNWREAYCFDKNLTSTQKFARLAVCLKTSFGGVWKAYPKWNYQFSTSAGHGNEKSFHLPELKKFLDFLKTIELTHGDYSKIAFPKDSKVYYYADPPYFDTSVNYEVESGETFQLDLISYLKNLSLQGCLVAESNYHRPDNFWENSFPNWNVFAYDFIHTASRGDVKKGKEVLVKNWT